MATPYIGEIRMFAGTYAPQGYLFCQGQLLSISQYEALFALISNTYGGDGQSTFALPNLSSRLAIHAGTDTLGNVYALAQTGGTEAVTLNGTNLPSHQHSMMCNNNSSSANSASGAGGTFGSTAGGSNTPLYGSNGGAATLSPKAIGPSGGNQSHANVKPYLCINYIIATEGTYPSRS